MQRSGRLLNGATVKFLFLDISLVSTKTSELAKAIAAATLRKLEKCRNSWMGHPSLLRWLKERYPAIGRRVDYLFVDFTFWIKRVEHFAHSDPDRDSAFAHALCSSVDRIVTFVEPKLFLVIARDGRAPELKQFTRSPQRPARSPHEAPAEGPVPF
jgi:hypothetical protein